MSQIAAPHIELVEMTAGRHPAHPAAVSTSSTSGGPIPARLLQPPTYVAAKVSRTPLAARVATTLIYATRRPGVVRERSERAS